MKFSIVTISFNQSEFIEHAILSVVEQDYPNIEYIVVDPGSTDGSREIIERYQTKMPGDLRKTPVVGDEYDRWYDEWRSTHFEISHIFYENVQSGRPYPQVSVSP